MTHPSDLFVPAGPAAFRVRPVDGLGIGRIVHYVLPDGPARGEHRPAIVVHVWGEPVPDNGCCQLQVFTDSDKDARFNDALPPVMWATSVVYDANGGYGTWHWPERNQE